MCIFPLSLSPYVCFTWLRRFDESKIVLRKSVPTEQQYPTATIPAERFSISKFLIFYAV